ncbi:SubName: Full=Uncharacterized protein {ECO:0000313/EMBL:CCA71284.1} [Serendipita indica DSM 11827]|uniref:DUF202 domain-containing protein n=1 Tax=Serendipita indica (strain DSM 11827) TaxID=1109443 RepID=G4TIZ2_SERID|nr:SubName: Full=Uncharacterized protein {ECO:0000313/EMBL:CCA71284.1} [Serendipita indica DSM 11827]CCA71284.1 hypothetical protein PIIN_05223 [Serendipita indica DSM 11827]
MNTPDGKRHFTYRGHRRKSFTVVDNAELVELRARQRTYDAGYTRSIVLTLGTAVLFLRVFDERFYNIGVLYIIIAGFLITAAYLRRRHSNRDFSDQLRPLPAPTNSTTKRIFGAPFVTAGWIVIFVSLILVGADIVLFVFILRL